MTARPSSARLRRECFEAHKITHQVTGKECLVCHICSGIIWPGKDAWEASHVIAHYFGGHETMPAHYKCHRDQTARKDIPEIAKSKRIADKHFGIRKKVAWGGKYRKKLDGSVVER